MGEVALRIPDAARDFLARTIREAGGTEVYFLGRLRWDESGQAATLEDVDVLARGHHAATPAIIEGAETWDVAIHNHPGGQLTPSDADLEIASELGNRQVAFVIIDNSARRHRVVVPPLRKPERKPIRPEEVRAVFESDGVLAQALARCGDGATYETRQGQIDMAVATADALNRDRCLALEAGTGVGKSFAYLVPAILWAARNHRRVVISTNTINLQEQLVNKDLPFLSQALPVRFRFALIKGRSNYACRRKVAEARESAAETFLEDGREKMLADLVEWAERSDGGSLSDLAMTPPADVWETVMSETDKSLKVSCPHYDRCFYYRAKQQAFKADIIVVNHHLFFADLAVRRETGNYTWNVILPGYDRVVFDEAHHLEDVASQHLGVRFTQEGLGWRFSRLASRPDRRSGESRGVLPALAKRLRQHGASAAAETIDRDLVPTVENVSTNVAAALAQVASDVRDHARGGEDLTPVEPLSGPLALHDSTPSRFQVRVHAAPELADLRRSIDAGLNEVQSELGILAGQTDRAARRIRTASHLGEEKKASLLLELTSLTSRLERQIAAVQFFRDASDTSHVRWIEVRRSRRRGREGDWTAHFATSPVRVCEDLKDSVFEPLKTVVLASATLSVDGKIDYFRERVGLDRVAGERAGFAIFDSPFRYTEQARALIPTDIPEPGQRGHEACVSDATFQLLRRLRGRTFVLFTSYTLLRRIFGELERPLRQLGIEPLRQGDLPRGELLARFRARDNRVLFGTDSFWEGVDVKGRALECVIITRLPFRVPSEPVQMARVEDLRARGISPFPHFAVPQAVLKFKQGFGRLIRTDTDRGVVVVLDRRLATRRYGCAFVNSLPPVPVSRAPLAELLRELESFLELRPPEQVGATPHTARAMEGGERAPQGPPF